jgi:hypothetical protein
VRAQYRDRTVAFWRLTDEERAAVWGLENELVVLLKKGWIKVRQEELAARTLALFTTDGSPRSWWCAAPARSDGSHLCAACSIAHQMG